MRVLLAGIGSRGDIQPLLALAQALRAAGHSAALCAPPDFAGWAAELGLDFVPSGQSMEAVMHRNASAIGASPVKLLGLIRDLIVSEVPLWFERVFEAAQGADAIVSANQFASRSVGEKLGIPVVGVLYSPTFLRSRHHAPLIGRMQHLPHWANSLSWAMNDAFVQRILIKPTNTGRARLGLAPIASVIDHYFVGYPYLLAADPVLARVPPDWTPRFDVTPTGPWFYRDDAALDPEVDAFLAAGPPPVYIGFGSMMTGDAARVTRAVIEGARGRRLLLSKGWAGLGAGKLPRDALVVHGPLPHAKVFPRVAAVVHHGGAGTTATALRAGAPQVIVPHLMDQYYWVDRLETLGLAPAGIPVAKLTAARLARALDATLALPPAPREAARARLSVGDGAARAVDFVERYVAAKRR